MLDTENEHPTPVLRRRENDEPRSILPLLAFALLVIAIALVLLSALPATAQESPGAQEINRIVLRVNDQILTLHDYERRKTRQVGRIMGDPSLDPDARQEQLAEIGRLIMRNAFEELLLRSRASQLSIIIDDTDVERAVQRMSQEQNITNQEELERALATSGMTLDELREAVRRDLIAQHLMQREMQDRIELDEDDLRAYYRDHTDEFRVPETRRLEEAIVFDSSGLDENQQRKVAEEILSAVAGGIPFAEAVAPYQDQGITSGVIELGWLQAEELGGALRDTAFSLELGAYSQPVEGRGGLHVLHLLELRESTLRPFSEVQDEIHNQERARRFQKETNAYMSELARRAYVRENLPPETVGYRDLVTFEETEDELEKFRAPTPPGKPDAEQSEG